MNTIKFDRPSSKVLFYRISLLTLWPTIPPLLWVLTSNKTRWTSSAVNRLPWFEIWKAVFFFTTEWYELEKPFKIKKQWKAIFSNFSTLKKCIPRASDELGLKTFKFCGKYYPLSTLSQNTIMFSILVTLNLFVTIILTVNFNSFCFGTHHLSLLIVCWKCHRLYQNKTNSDAFF